MTSDGGIVAALWHLEGVLTGLYLALIVIAVVQVLQLLLDIHWQYFLRNDDNE